MSPRTRREICEELRDLTHQSGYLYSLAMMLRHDLFLDPAEAADIDWTARLSFQELQFIAGLLISKELDLAVPSMATVQRQIQRTYELCHDLHLTHHEAFLVEIAKHLPKHLGKHPVTSSEFVKATQELFGSGEMMTEPIFYGGSGAYDFQYWALTLTRYDEDSTWIRETMGFEIKNAVEIVRSLKDLQPPFIDGELQHEAAMCGLFEMFCFSLEDLSTFPSDQVDAFINAFEVIPGNANEEFLEPGQYNRTNSHPLIQITPGKYFLPVHFTLSQSLYESPFYWMAADPSYAETSFRHRGAATERMAADFLQPVFGAGRVYQNVKLYAGKEEVGEIDVLAVLGDKAWIIECKSKRLTELARRGDTERLRTDFGLAVQAAYDQARAARSCLLDGSLDIREGSRTINIPRVSEAFITCLVSDHYPALAHQLPLYLEKREEDPPPVAMSVFDLDVLTFYLSDPFELLYYVRQRTALAEHIHTDDEMAVLAYHLHRKLFKMPKADKIFIASSYAQLVDANFPAAKGEQPRTEAADRLHHGWKNEKFNELVRDVAEGGDDGWPDAVFLLYDLAGEAVDQLIEAIMMAQSRTSADGEKHSVASTFAEIDSGISYVAVPRDSGRLETEALVYGQAKKYDTRATTWLALGGIGGSPRLVEFVAFNQDVWEEDIELAELARTALKPGTLMRMKGKIGRNEPCFCGSGLKYKRCHG